MTHLIDIRAFLVTARVGSFSGAGRELGLAPSVITKRVSRLERSMGAPLIRRTTRRLDLTALGDRVRSRFQVLIAELDDVINGAEPADGTVEGHLRIKTPQTVTALYLGEILADFHAANPRLTLDIMMIDRSVNPMEEGFDVTIGALPASYANVVDVPLCPYDRVLCATPSYLEAMGVPNHPNDLVEHDCLTFIAFGTTWSFDTPSAQVNVEVRSKFNVNDSRVLMGAALRGIGLAILPKFLVRDHLKAGILVEVLPETPVSPLWLKALVPRIKRNRPAIEAMIAYLKQRLSPVPPWDQLS